MSGFRKKKTPPLKKARILGLETNATPCYLRKNSKKTKKEMNVTLYFRILHAILCLRDWRGDLKSGIALCQNFWCGAILFAQKFSANKKPEGVDIKL